LSNVEQQRLCTFETWSMHLLSNVEQQCLCTFETWNMHLLSNVEQQCLCTFETWNMHLLSNVEQQCLRTFEFLFFLSSSAPMWKVQPLAAFKPPFDTAKTQMQHAKLWGKTEEFM